MAIFGVKFCLSLLVACIIVSMPLTQGRSLRRRHGHHSHSDYYNLDESLPRDLSGRREDDVEYYRDSYGQKRREYSQVLDRSSEYDDSEERVPASFRRYRHDYDSREHEFLRKDSLHKHDDFDVLSTRGMFVARRKRNNKHDNTVNYQRIEHNKRNGHNHRFELHSDENDNFSFELEVKEAQNRSICNYTVESIPDTRGSRVPKDLEHVKCNHIGSSCQGTGTYCCTQTYRNIEVSYGNGDKETMKLYVGCVCAHQVFNNIQESQLAIND